MIVAYETFDRFVAPLRVSSIKRVNIYFISLLAHMKLYELKIQNWENIHFFLTLCCYQFATSLSPFFWLIASICDFFVQRIAPSFPRLSLRYQRWSLSSAKRFVILCLLSPCGYHPLWYQKTPFSKSCSFAKKSMDFSKKATNEQKLQKNSDKVGVSTLSFCNHVEIEDFPWNVRHSWTSFMLPSGLIGATLAWWNTSTWWEKPHWETWEPNSVIDIW